MEEVQGKILILSCCAPCACAVVEDLARRKGKFEVLFYNPNIRPYGEYVKRRDENLRLCGQYGVAFAEGAYEPEAWDEAVRGLELEPERGRRCFACFKMRLKKAMAYARENGFSAVGSVLGVSRHKDLAQVDAAALEASRETDVEYVRIEGRKGGMQERRAALIRELGLYEQKYCGCSPNA